MQQYPLVEMVTTPDDETAYIQDKYDDNLVHVSDGGGTYTFHLSHGQMETPYDRRITIYI